jgi:uncharacterized protein YqgQ
MARSYLVGSWNDADSYDYSGEQLMGHRQGSSVCVDHMLPNGRANLSRYSDVEDKPKTIKKSIRAKICPQQTRLDNLEKMKEELDAEYNSGAMPVSEYLELSAVLDKKIDRAYELLSRAMGWDRLSNTELENLDFRNQEQLPQHYDFTIDEKVLSNAMFEHELIEKDNSLFMSLSVDNVWRKGYIAFRKLQNKFTK